jgi:putative addiction module component (TIGR02574 family)
MEECIALHNQLCSLPLEARLEIIEVLMESVRAEREAEPLSDEVRELLDKELAAYEEDGGKGRPLEEVIERWRSEH